MFVTSTFITLCVGYVIHKKNEMTKISIGLENKMGRKVTEAIKKMHLGRRMFGVIDDELKIAQPNNPLSHLEWFLNEGWIVNYQDKSFEEIVRGMVSPEKEIYFYVGKHFSINEKTEQIFFRHLPELAERLNLNKIVQVHGGL